MRTVGYDALETAFAVQCNGLIAGGIDAFLIETCQDPLQVKAAVNGAKLARAAAGADLPIMVQVTVETTGTLLVGADVAAAATVLKAMNQIGLAEGRIFDKGLLDRAEEVMTDVSPVRPRRRSNRRGAPARSSVARA